MEGSVVGETFVTRAAERVMLDALDASLRPPASRLREFAEESIRTRDLFLRSDGEELPRRLEDWKRASNDMRAACTPERLLALLDVRDAAEALRGVRVHAYADAEPLLRELDGALRRTRG
jgi:porphobilinogen deaminase